MGQATSTPRQRARLAAAAAAVVVVGLLAVAESNDSSLVCGSLRHAAGLDDLRPTATQSWDDIYTLQGTVTEGLAARAAFEDACT